MCLLALREVEQRLGIAPRLAVCIADPRAPEGIQVSLADMSRFRLLRIGTGNEEGNDAASRRWGPRRQRAFCAPVLSRARIFMRDPSR